MGFFLVLKAEVVRSLIIMRRYWFATLTGLFMGYGVIMILIVGFMSERGNEVSEMVGNRFGVDPERAVNAALGFIIGALAYGIVGIFTQGLQGMARSGQLEQLCLSPHGLVTNFLARSFVGACTSVFTSSILLWLVVRSVAGSLHVDPLPTLLLVALAYVNLIGFGFMCGGLVLVFKQTGQIAMIVRMALLALAISASERVDTGTPALDWLMHALPITDAAICLKHVLVSDQILDGQYLSVFQHPSFLFLLANCFVWTAIGIALFRVMENWSRDKGTLGAY